jgi:hypothetical protein
MIALNEPMNTDPITDIVQTRTNEETQRNPGCATRPLLGRRRVLGHGLGAFGNGMLSQLAGEDESDTAKGLARARRVAVMGIRTRSGSRVMRWLTSCCRQPAWKPRWRRAQKCLQRALEETMRHVRTGALTVDERVENAHGPVANTSVGVDLLQDCDALECCMRLCDARKAYPCKCRRSRSPSWSWCASSSRQRERPSSCQPPSSRQAPCQPGPCRRWWESSGLWEAFWVIGEVEWAGGA